MKLLLDTHVFLWHISGDSRLPAAFQIAIVNPANEVYLSVASVWEAVIKHALGKLPLPAPPAEYLPRQRQAYQIATLALTESTFVHLAKLPLLHRDPFDRILISESMHYSMTLVTVDPQIKAYAVATLPQ